MIQKTIASGAPGPSSASSGIRKAAIRRIPPTAVSVLPRRRTIDLNINTVKKVVSGF